jgi:hypothetical protein
MGPFLRAAVVTILLVMLVGLGSTLALAQSSSEVKAESPTGAKVLVLIAPKVAGPQIPLSIDENPNWIRWQSGRESGQKNDNLARLLEISSGRTWEAADRYFQFRPDGNHLWTSDGLVGLQRKGFAVATAEHLGSRRFVPLETDQGAVASESLTVAMDPRFGQIRSIPYPQALESDGLYVYVAKSWNELESLRQRGASRIIAVEFPPPPGQGFSHLWVKDGGWGSGTLRGPNDGVPGLFAPRNLVSLLTQDPLETIAPVPARNPMRWMMAASDTGGKTIWLGFILMTVATLALGVCVIRERPWPAVMHLGRASILIPAAWMLSGWLNLWLGPSGAPFWLLLTWMLLALIAWAWSLRTRDKKANLAPVFWVGLLASLIGQLTFGPVSPVFSASGGIGFVSLIGYLTGLAAINAGNPASWIVRVACLLVALRLPFPWDGLPDVPAVLVTGLVFAAIVIGERWLPFWVPAAVALLALGSKTIAHGAVVARDGQFTNYWDSEAVNVLGLIQSLTHPFWVIVLATILGLLFVGNRFLFHQVRRWARLDPRAGAMATLTLVVLLTGLSEPILLTGLPILVLMTLLVASAEIAACT